MYVKKNIIENAALELSVKFFCAVLAWVYDKSQGGSVASLAFVGFAAIARCVLTCGYQVLSWR